MARKVRVEYPDAVYHVMSRGARRYSGMSRSEPSYSENGIGETLALTPALSPRRGGRTHSSRNFHAIWCRIAS